MGTTLLLVGLTRQAGPLPLGEHLTGFVEHGLWGFQLCAILVKLQLVFFTSLICAIGSPLSRQEGISTPPRSVHGSNLNL